MIPSFEEFISTLNLYSTDEHFQYKYGIDSYGEFREASRQIISSVFYEDEAKLKEWCNVLINQCHGYQYEVEMDHILNFIVLEFKAQNREILDTSILKILYKDYSSSSSSKSSSSPSSSPCMP